MLELASNGYLLLVPEVVVRLSVEKRSLADGDVAREHHLAQHWVVLFREGGHMI